MGLGVIPCRSLVDGTWDQRPTELELRLTFEIEDMTLQMQ